jgi:type I restriction-modification system DNA methylase subunit
MAKSKTNKPRADIDFENELWNAANELRGAVAENQYKDYVLSLLFVKHMSERYEIRKAELQKEFNTPGSDYFPSLSLEFKTNSSTAVRMSATTDKNIKPVYLLVYYLPLIHISVRPCPAPAQGRE